MATARELLISKSGYPQGTSTARERMKAIEAASVVIAPALEKVVTKIIRAPATTKKKRVRIPQVSIMDNSPQAIQQAMDELIANVKKGLA